MAHLRTYRKDDDSERNLKHIRDALQSKFGSFVNYSNCIRYALGEAAKALPLPK